MNAAMLKDFRFLFSIVISIPFALLRHKMLKSFAQGINKKQKTFIIL